MTLVQRGDIKGMSFSMMNGFEESFATTEANGQNVVNATRYTVDEVSILVDPAFIDTSVQLLEDDDKDDDSDEEGEVQPAADTESDPEYSANQKKVKESQFQKWNEYRLYILSNR